jgi:hypothetical protein
MQARRGATADDCFAVPEVPELTIELATRGSRAPAALRYRFATRAVTGTLVGLTAALVRKHLRAAPVSPLGSLPVWELSSRGACRQWAARFGREQQRGVGCADCSSADPGRRVVP